MSAQYCVILSKSNRTLSAALQQHAFSLGYKWGIGGTEEPRHLNEICLYLWTDMRLCYGDGDSPADSSTRVLTIEEWFALNPKPAYRFKVHSRSEEFVLSENNLTVGCHILTKADALVVANNILEYYK